MKKVLVLGGTNFIGRVLVEKLLAENLFDLTLFNRGKRNASLFPSIKRITGDRETTDHLLIANQSWDCIIDLSGYYPASFQNLLSAIQGKVHRYIFVSTLSVYDIGAFAAKTITEADPTLACTPEQKTSKLPDAYGEKKAEMERILLMHKNFDKIIIRPSFVYGRYDFTDRFYHWLWRGRTQNHILLPSSDSFAVALTDVQQLADGLIAAIEIKTHQTIYNAVTFNQYTLRDICLSGVPNANTQPKFTVLTEPQLQQQQVGYGQFPLFIPFDFSVDNAAWLRDLASPTPAGLLTPDTESYYDQLNWYEPKAGLSMSIEEKLLSLESG